MGRQLRARLSAVRPDLQDKMQKKSISQDAREIGVGEQVMVERGLDTRSGLERLRFLTYRVEVDNLI